MTYITRLALPVLAYKNELNESREALQRYCFVKTFTNSSVTLLYFVNVCKKKSFKLKQSFDRFLYNKIIAWRGGYR